MKFWVPLASGPTAEQNKILHPALLRGRERCSHHLPMSSLLPLWVARLRASWTWACRQVWRGHGRAGRPACDRLHNAAWWKAAAAAWERRRPQGTPTATSKLRAAAGVEAAGFLRRMMCLNTSVCFCAAENCWANWTVLGRSVTREHSGTVPSPAPSCQRDTARDGAPGPLAWTSHDPETVRSPSSLEARGPSQHAAHVEPPGRDHPRAGLSGLWPGGPAVTPWRGGQKPPPHRLYKHCQLDLTNTYRPVRGDMGHPAGW